MDSDIHMVLSPGVETYDDNMMGLKGAARAVIMIKDKPRTAQLQKYRKLAGEFESSLPCKDDYKNSNQSTPPIDVVNAIYLGGQAHRIPHFIAFNLPNERKYGYRIFIMKNSEEVRVTQTNYKIARKLMSQDQLGEFSLKDLQDASTLVTMLHEFSHSHGRLQGGTHDDIHAKLGEHYNRIEEGKAQILGLFHLSNLVNRGFITEKQKRAAYFANVPSMLGTLRHGLGSAHTYGYAYILNHFLDSGAVSERGDRYDIDYEKMEKTIAKLAQKVLTIEGEGDYREAGRFLRKHAVVRPEVDRMLKPVKGLPHIVLEYPHAD